MGGKGLVYLGPIKHGTMKMQTTSDFWMSTTTMSALEEVTGLGFAPSLENKKV